MAFRYVPDGNGEMVRLYDDDGRILHMPIPYWNRATLMPSREDDVLLCTYPSSGIFLSHFHLHGTVVRRPPREPQI